MFAGIFLIINSKSAGMSKTMQYTHNPPQNSGVINYNSITEICEIKLHYTFFSKAWKLRFQNVIAFHVITLIKATDARC